MSTENESILVTDKDFDEQAYLASNPDVAKAVQDGRIASGKAHFEQFGREEKRRIQTSHLTSPFRKRGAKITIILSIFANKVISLVTRLIPGFRKTLKRKASPLDQLFHVRRRAIAQEYIHGAGIEIGALHQPLPVPRDARVNYVDRLSVQQLREHYPDLNELPLVNVDILTNGETLESIPDDSQDFVVANHFLEHCQNPLFTIESFLRVLKPNGVVFLAIPDKRYTFDIDRPVTTYGHLEMDYKDGGTNSKRQHFEEWIRLVHHITDEAEVIKHVDRLMSVDYSIHFHVWTQIEMIEMMLRLRRKLKFEMELVCRNDNEVIFILRKT